MRVAEIRSLFDYNEWANARIFSAVAGLEPDVFGTPRGSSFSSIRDTIAHIAASEWIWLRRWRGESPLGPPPWGALGDGASLAAKLKEVELDRREFLSDLTDESVRSVISYRNLRGEESAQPVLDQLLHVVNHSTYHRGQVATLCRQAGSPVPATDFIVFKRENG